jgi:hypothetical protein
VRYVYSTTNFNPNREKLSLFIYFSGKKVKYIKDTLNASDEEIKRFLSMPYKSLLIQTIDPKTGERIGYLFDSLRCIAKGTGRLPIYLCIDPWGLFNQAHQ